MEKSHKKIVCLGGGIGTVNLIKGLKDYTDAITVVISVADDGGSSGRLRRAYHILPPGDLVSCMAALTNDEQISGLLTYRFPGERYGSDDALGGHKLGNLLMVAARDITNDFEKAIKLLKSLFQVDANLFPSSLEPITISAVTTDGVHVEGEEKIDLGKYNGHRTLEYITLHPEHPIPTPGIIEAMRDADAIVLGPGDLYTTLLPVLLIPEIGDFLKKTSIKKTFIVNVANKPFETRGYSVADFIRAVKKHLGVFPFETVIVNDNFTPEIPKRYQYTYVTLSEPSKIANEAPETTVLTADLVDAGFPLYHDSEKLASFVFQAV